MRFPSTLPNVLVRSLSSLIILQSALTAWDRGLVVSLDPLWHRMKLGVATVIYLPSFSMLQPISRAILHI